MFLNELPEEGNLRIANLTSSISPSLGHNRSVSENAIERKPPRENLFLLATNSLDATWVQLVYLDCLPPAVTALDRTQAFAPLRRQQATKENVPWKAASALAKILARHRPINESKWRCGCER